MSSIRIPFVEKSRDCLAALLLVGVAGCAGEGSVPDATAAAREAVSRETVVVLGAKLIDGAGGAPIDDAVLVLRGDRIVAVGAAQAMALPTGARVLRYPGKTILPGLITDHSHVGIVDGLRGGAEQYNRSNILRQLRQYEAYGVTTTTSLGLNGSIFEALRTEMHAGKTRGADLFGVDRGLGVPGGGPSEAVVQVGPDQILRPATAEQAREAVRAMVGRRTDLVKLWLDDFGGTLPKMSPEVYRAAIDEAHRHGVRVAAHIHDLGDAKAAIRAGADILAHGVRDEAVDTELVSLLKEHGTWYVPTLQLDEAAFVYADRPAWTTEPFVQRALQPAVRAQFDDPAWRERISNAPAAKSARAALAMNLRNLKTLHDAGVAIGFGTDSGATPVRIPGVAEHRELVLMVEAGLTPLQAIGIATREAAALLRLGDRGTLVPGKMADFVVVDRDPSQAIANTQSIAAVWHRGQCATCN